jgi:hypothetical protein
MLIPASALQIANKCRWEREREEEEEEARNISYIYQIWFVAEFHK